MIIDCHVHIDQPGEAGQDPAADLLRAADRMGIDLLCVSALLGAERQQPTPEEIRESNDLVWSAVETHPERIAGYCYLNPCYLQQSLEEMERCIANGPFPGVKLWVSLFCDQPNLDPIAERAAELKAPILQSRDQLEPTHVGGAVVRLASPPNRGRERPLALVETNRPAWHACEGGKLVDGVGGLVLLGHCTRRVMRSSGSGLCVGFFTAASHLVKNEAR